MIVSTIKQYGLKLRADPEEIPFQYSANVQMKFEKDENYSDYAVVGYYIPPGESEAKLLALDENGLFTLGPDCFKNRGTLSFSFNLINSQEEVHLGSIDFEVRYAFGDSDTILPEPEEVWISLVTQVAKDAIKQDAELVKQKANEALQSASLANDKANEAQEYANNANDAANTANISASSALNAKNDAIVASGSAIQAKQDAEQSANNAKNSANTALENANKSNEAIKTVTQIKTEIENKANDFDTNYQEKLKSFNDNATSKQNAFDNSVQTANTNFDNKVTQANSDLDAKVQEATNQAKKAKEEADRATQATESKLDKFQGKENAGLTVIVGEDGNLKLGSAMPKEVYTKEEVDYLLADKMDKPYVPIEITDSTTLNDCLAGNFKIDSIKGNTVQKVEENIVPTPSRAVPINSRKVKANDGYVELRSLKETSNLFDLKYGQLLFGEEKTTSANGKITNNGESVIIENIYAATQLKIARVYLKANVKYTYKASVTSEIIEGVEQGSNSSLLGFWKDNSPIKQIALNTAYTPAESGFYDLYLYGGVGYKKTYSNLMLVEGESIPSTYIPPTVRDYKIVDHVNKTAKIIRNIRQRRLTSADNFYMSGFGGPETNLKDCLLQSTKYNKNNFCTLFNIDYTHGVLPDNLSVRLEKQYLLFNYQDYNELEKWDTFIDSNELIYQYQLATPVEEPITYVETDTNEVGYSWQDTTSPSPTIKSEVTKIDKIDSTVCEKNLFDLEKAKDKLNWPKNTTNNWPTFLIKVGKNKKVTISYEANLSIGLDFLAGIVNAEDISGSYLSKWLYNNTNQSLIVNTVTIITKGDYIAISSSNIDKFLQYLVNFQVEYNDVKTPYEPYTEQHINIIPPQPMYQNDIANIESGEYEYYMKQKKLTGDEEWKEYKEEDKLNQFYFYFDGVNHNNDEARALSNIAKPIALANRRGNFGTVYSVSGGIGFNIENLTLEEWKQFLKDNEVYIYYATTEIVKIPIPPEDLAKLKSLKTNAGVTNVFINGEVKPIIEARYPRDLALVQQQLEQKILLISDSLIDTQVKVLLQGGDK